MELKYQTHTKVYVGPKMKRMKLQNHTKVWDMMMMFQVYQRNQ